MRDFLFFDFLFEIVKKKTKIPLLFLLFGGILYLVKIEIFQPNDQFVNFRKERFVHTDKSRIRFEQIH